jgi:hypothetical protein
MLCVDIYVISLFVLMESKKNKKIAFSPLCRVPHSAKRALSSGTRQSWEANNQFPSFAECPTWHSAKRPSQLTADFFTECLRGTRQLPSARYLTLGKETFADRFFAECSSSSAALGKAFVECNRGFAECPEHSAKSPSAVVMIGR